MKDELHVIDKLVASHDWKKSVIKKKKKNPIKLKNCCFYLCQENASLLAGYVYYLLACNHRGRVLLEKESPRFRTQQEILSFVDDNKPKGCIPIGG